jgi:hypothetical protein
MRFGIGEIACLTVYHGELREDAADDGGVFAEHTGPDVDSPLLGCGGFGILFLALINLRQHFERVVEGGGIFSELLLAFANRGGENLLGVDEFAAVDGRAGLGQ